LKKSYCRVLIEKGGGKPSILLDRGQNGEGVGLLQLDTGKGSDYRMARGLHPPSLEKEKRLLVLL